MRILITGSRGLYGVHLIDLLVKKKTVSQIFAVDNNSRRSLKEDPYIRSEEFEKKITIMNMDYQNLDTHKLNQLSLDVVVHLAAYVSIDESMVEPFEYFENNEQGTFRFVQALKGTLNKPFLIYASSPEVYGNPQYVPMDENHPLHPRSTYAVSKLAAEKHCMTLYEWYGYPVCVIRNFNTFGENQNVWGWPAAIPSFIEKALKNDEIVVHDEGQQTRDFMYVKDAVRAYELLIDKGKPMAGKEFNIGTGKETKIIDLAKKIVELTNSKSKIRFEKGRPGDLVGLQADVNRIKKDLGWEPKIPMEEGLKQTIAWYKENVGALTLNP